MLLKDEAKVALRGTREGKQLGAESGHPSSSASSPLGDFFSGGGTIKRCIGPEMSKNSSAISSSKSVLSDIKKYVLGLVQDFLRNRNLEIHASKSEDCLSFPIARMLLKRWNFRML